MSGHQQHDEALEESAYRAEMANEKPVDWDRWIKQPYWTAYEAAKLLLMLNPDEEMKPVEYVDLKRWTELESRTKKNYTPAEWVQRAADRGMVIPEQLLPLLEGGNESGEGLDVFKNMPNLTASEVTVRLLRKDENSQPDRVEISARGKARTVFCTDLGLIGKKPKGLLNREGKMLFALASGIIPKNVKSPEQAMTKLRKIFKDKIGMKGDPFHPKGMDWKPRFKLLDAIKQADKRATLRTLPAKDRIKASKKDDADIWLAEHDK